MADEWGRPGFPQVFVPKSSLPGVIREMKLGTRQAIYAVAVKAKFRRGTWNGCVMNQVADGSNNVQMAANYFGEPSDLIARFIAKWDETSGHITSDVQATKVLIHALMAAGLVDTPSETPVQHKVWRVAVYTSDETLMVEELRNEIEDGAFDSLLERMEEFSLV